MIHTIFFDMDGTLYDDTNPRLRGEMHLAEVLAKACAIPFGEAYTRFRAAKHTVSRELDGDPRGIERSRWSRRFLEDVSEPDGGEGHSPALPSPTPEELELDYWGAFLEEMEPYPDVPTALEELTGKCALHVITDELEWVAERKLERLNLRRFFGQVVSCSHAGKMKPHPEIFRLALERTGAEPGQSIMVGDNPTRDVRGAKAVGMQTAWLRRGRFYFYSGEDVPDLVIGNFRLFPAQLEDRYQLHIH